jgi:transposase-like zinc ribbon protein
MPPKTEDEARALLEEIRWHKGCVNAAGPRCGVMEPYRLTPKPRSCTRKGAVEVPPCRKQFTVTVATVFEDSPAPLVKWWLAISPTRVVKEGHQRASTPSQPPRQLPDRMVHGASPTLRDDAGANVGMDEHR